MSIVALNFKMHRLFGSTCTGVTTKFPFRNATVYGALILDVYLAVSNLLIATSNFEV